MKSLFLFVLIGSMALQINAAPTSDSIQVYHNVMGFQFYKNNIRLEKLDAIKTLSTNRVARTAYYHATNSCFFSGLTGGVGGCLLGWQFAKYIDRNEANAAPVAIGAGLVVGSIILHVHGMRSMANAVYTYNEGITKTKSKAGIWRIEPLGNANGVGIAIRKRKE